MEPIFFTGPEEFGAWLAEHHATETEVIVGYWKRASGRRSIGWQQAVREALRFGWIDGRIKRIDDQSHEQRFTPRRPGSTWSNVNVRNVEDLIAQGRMEAAGLAAFEARTAANTGIYSFEAPEPAMLSAEYEERLLGDQSAWEFWVSQPPSYRTAAAHWVMSAKRPETRERRITALISASHAGLRA